MDIYSEAKVSPKGKLNDDDLKRIAFNVLIFTAPTLVVFFGQLQMGVEPRAALLVAALALYGSLADLFKKLSNK